MRILITGGNGYIAKSLYNSLKNKHDITCITRQDLDLTSFKEMNKFFRDKYFDVVIHCAVQGGSRLRLDSYKDMDVNLVMYYNLLQHKSHYNKLIHFGSGAELYNSESPYGLSKRIITKSILETDNFYNIRKGRCTPPLNDSLRNTRQTRPLDLLEVIRYVLESTRGKHTIGFMIMTKNMLRG